MSRKYLAYSSNIAPAKMMELCPTARFMGHTDIEEYRLVFAGGANDAVATIEPATGYSVPALAWKIHAEDEAILDNYMEFQRHFLKKEFEVWLRGDRVKAMAYVMAPGYNYGAPNEKYLAEIRKGYDAVGIDESILDEAVAYSAELHNEK